MTATRTRPATGATATAWHIRMVGPRARRSAADRPVADTKPRSNQIRSPVNRSVTGSHGKKMSTSSETAIPSVARRPTDPGWCRSASRPRRRPAARRRSRSGRTRCRGRPRTAPRRTAARRRGPPSAGRSGRSRRRIVGERRDQAVDVAPVLGDRVADPQPLDPPQLRGVEPARQLRPDRSTLAHRPPAAIRSSASSVRSTSSAVL